MKTNLELKWNDVEKYPPPFCQPVLGYSPEWEDADFNESGMRECHLMDGGTWVSAHWDNDADGWIVDESSKPTLWLDPMQISPVTLAANGWPQE